jgi:voltage-gated potassium channel
MHPTTFSGHHIVIGWNAVSRTVITELLRAGYSVALFTPRQEDLPEVDAYFPGETRLYRTWGLYEDEGVYKRLGVESAAGAVLVCQDDSKTLITAVQMHKISRTMAITAHIENMKLKETFRSAGVNYVASANEIVGRMMASAAFEPDVHELLEDLLSTAYEKGLRPERGGQDDAAPGDAYDIQEYRVTRLPHGVERYAELAAHLANMGAGRLLGISRLQTRIGGVEPGAGTQDAAAAQWVLEKDPAPDTAVHPGDYLIAIVSAEQSARLKDALGCATQGRVTVSAPAQDGSTQRKG